MASRLVAVTPRLEAVASRLKMLTPRLEAVASRLNAVTRREEMPASRLEAVARLPSEIGKNHEVLSDISGAVKSRAFTPYVQEVKMSRHETPSYPVSFSVHGNPKHGGPGQEA